MFLLLSKPNDENRATAIRHESIQELSITLLIHKNKYDEHLRLLHIWDLKLLLSLELNKKGPQNLLFYLFASNPLQSETEFTTDFCCLTSSWLPHQPLNKTLDFEFLFNKSVHSRTKSRNQTLIGPLQLRKQIKQERRTNGF